MKNFPVESFGICPVKVKPYVIGGFQRAVTVGMMAVQKRHLPRIYPDGIIRTGYFHFSGNHVQQQKTGKKVSLYNIVCVAVIMACVVQII